MSFLCAAQLPDGRVFAGASYPSKKHAYLYNEMGETWTRFPDLPGKGQDSAACGVAQSADGGSELVVAGGWDGSRLSTSAIFNFEINQWRDGPSLPHGTQAPTSLPYGDSFLVIGGRTETNVYLDTIYQFKIDGWQLWDQRLQQGRFDTVALYVDPAKLGCTT